MPLLLFKAFESALSLHPKVMILVRHYSLRKNRDLYVFLFMLFEMLSQRLFLSCLPVTQNSPTHLVSPFPLVTPIYLLPVAPTSPSPIIPALSEGGAEALHTLFHSSREGWGSAKRCVANSPGCTFIFLPQMVCSPQPPCPPFDGCLPLRLNTLTWAQTQTCLVPGKA